MWPCAGREVLERGLPVLLGRERAGGDASLAEKLQALPQPAMHTLLAAVHSATRACLIHRTRHAPFRPSISFLAAIEVSIRRQC